MLADCSYDAIRAQIWRDQWTFEFIAQAARGNNDLTDCAETAGSNFASRLARAGL